MKTLLFPEMRKFDRWLRNTKADLVPMPKGIRTYSIPNADSLSIFYDYRPLD